MTLLGIHLTLLIGATIPVPAPTMLTEALQQAEVTHSDATGSGFQLTFAVGRGGSQSLLDYGLLSNPLLNPFNRVILLVTTGAIPHLLMDGIITHHQLQPGSEPGASTLTVMGRDVSVMMGREEKEAEHPAQNEAIIVEKLILSYARYGLIPEVIPPPILNIPLPTETIPVQHRIRPGLHHGTGRSLWVSVLCHARPATWCQHSLLGATPSPGHTTKSADGEHGPGDQCQQHPFHPG